MDSRAHRGPITAGTVMTIPVKAHIRGRLLCRYKRFFADVLTEDGREMVVHCPNPGRMTGLLRAGAAVRCSTSSRPKRKLRNTLEMIRVGSIWVGVHTLRANQLAEYILREGSIPSLSGYADIKREVNVGKGTRLDFYLTGNQKDPRPAYLEVKSVTLARGREAIFPDSITTRGRRHVETLGEIIQSGMRSVLLFIVQRSDCLQFSTADDIDFEYGEALRHAVDLGVEVIACRASVGPSAIRFQRLIPVSL